MKSIPALLASATLLATVSCNMSDRLTFRYQTDPDIRTLAQANTPSYPDMQFIVLADTHYFAPELGTSGTAFDDYLRQDRKMLKESPEILQAAVVDIHGQEADFLIVCGDLTKDGERESHVQVASVLTGIEARGKAVFVVPGNHDIGNGESMSFTGETAQPVPTVDAAEFRNIYKGFGFSEAIATDPDSLSYVAEPVPGLWLMGLDSCRYRENLPDGHPITDGRFYDSTLTWIETQLIDAIRQHKAVIGFLHHGVLEHYPSNEKHFGDYLLDDFEPVSKMFAAYGMRFVFTGHYHAQDVVKKSWASPIPNHFLFDIETGSLVTWPVPWRHVALQNQTMTITSHTVQAIDSHPDDFREFAEQFVVDGMTGIINETLTGYGVPQTDQELLTPQITEAYVTHLQGDEQPPEPYLDFTGVSPAGRLVGTVQGDLIRGWYTDLPPADSSLSGNMTTGQIQ